MTLSSTLVGLLLSAVASEAIQCWQCAASEGNLCPEGSKTYTSASHDACITWRLGNGTIILQNLVVASEECPDEKINFWSRFIDLYYKSHGGQVSCCYTDSCNDGSFVPSGPVQQSQSIASQPFNLYIPGTPAPVLNLGLTRKPPLASQISPFGNGFPSQGGFPSSRPIQNFQSNDLNNLNYPTPKREGNCEKYFDKTEADEWIPDVLVPLAYDRASEAKVGVFFAKFGSDIHNNDHIIARIVDKTKRNLTMYSIKLFRVGTVSIHISKLETSRGGDTFIQQDGRKISVNNAIELDEDAYQGFWISIRDNIDISIGRIGDKLINSLANYTDVLREGPSESYYFGLTTGASTSASFGVNCDMPGLHFEDTCVTDFDCEEFPQTICRDMPVNIGLDKGTRNLPFHKWNKGDELLKSCWCKEGHIRIPESKGCYDPIRKVITLGDACFADYHCNDLPNTVCADDREMPKYNKSCQCVPGNKAFEADPRTGLIEGCAPLTMSDKATISGCARKFRIEDKDEWVPEVTYPMEHDNYFNVDVGVFFVTLGAPYDEGNHDSDVAVIRLLDAAKGRRKMLTIKIFRKNGKIALYNSAVTRSFFFSDQTEREVDSIKDAQTLRRLEEGYVGFWVQYKYTEGYGGQVSVGLNGAPFDPNYALIKWNDNGNTAMESLKYMGFTSGTSKGTIDYGANCVLLKTQIGVASNPYTSISAEQIQSLYPTKTGAPSVSLYHQQLQALQAANSNPSSQGNPWDISNNNPPAPQVNPWDLINSGGYDALTLSHQIQSAPQHTIVEPVLKNPYLSKLKRLLPTVFDDFPDDRIEQALREASETKV